MEEQFMRRSILLVSLLLLVFVIFSCTKQEPVAPESAKIPTGGSLSKKAAAGDTESADHFVVKFDGNIGQLTAAVASAGGSLDRVHSEINYAQVSGISDAQAAQLGSADGIEQVTRDLIVQWLPHPDDLDLQTEAAAEGHVVGDPTTAFFYPCQWNMSQINAPGAWAQGEFGANAKVAVLDTGVDPNHQDLAGRIDIANSVSMLSTTSICDLFAPDQATFIDFNFHGSFVSGIVAGNGFGVTGVAPDAQIVGVKVLNCQGSGSFADVIAGILYASGVPGVEVINMSLGARFPKNAPGAAPLVAGLNKAVNFAATQGVLVVSSAGNNGVDLDHDRNFINTPAQSGSGISAWAGDVNGGLAGYSNHGRSGAWVGAGGGDLTSISPLPGCSIPLVCHSFMTSVCSSSSLFFNCGSGVNYLICGAGTSFSAPMVSGVAALVDGKNGGALNGGQLRTVLSNTADDLGKKGVDNTFSHGRVNANNAVQ